MSSSTGYHIDSQKGVFKKTVPHDQIEHEIEMNRLAYKSSSEFKVPEVLKVDLDKGELEFELIKNARTIREVFIEKSKLGAFRTNAPLLTELFVRLGKSLATIHRFDPNDDRITVRRFPDSFFSDSFKTREVVLHGDFTLSNTLFDEETNDLIVLDWNISTFFNFSANYGPAYWDVSYLICSLFFASPATLFSYKMRETLALKFLSGYLQSFSVEEKKEFVEKLNEFIYAYNYFKLYKSANSKGSVKSKFLIFVSKKHLNRFNRRLTAKYAMI